MKEGGGRTEQGDESRAFPQLLFRLPSLADLPPLAPPQGYEIRPIRPGEEAPAAECLTLAFGDPWDEARVRRDLSESSFVRRMFVAVSSGSIAGTASAACGADWPDAGYVHYVAVHPRHQGRGLGQILTLACLHEFVRIGLAAAVLQTDDHRHAAIASYLKLGFALDLDSDPSFPSRWRVIAGQMSAPKGLRAKGAPDG